MKTILLTDGQQLRYELTRKRVKNINFRIAPDGMIKVSANSRVSEKYIVDYLTEHSAEFIRAIDRTLARQSRTTCDSTETVHWLGNEYPVELMNDGGEFAELGDNCLYLHTLSDNKQDWLDIISSWRSAAFVQLLQELNDEVRSALVSDGKDPPPTVITIKEMKSRWGSCSYNKGHISINYRLASFPRETVLGVLWHEYTHYWHHDHQKEFYKQLLYFYPDYYRWDKLLK